MRSATLISNPSTDEGTFGVMLLDDHTSFVTGELPWRNNDHGLSCIPASEPGKPYICKWINSPKHGECYQVTGVPRRDFIEIHSANFCGDKLKGFECQLLGCIALGKTVEKMSLHVGAPLQMAITSSKTAIAEFEANMGKQDFELTVVRKG